jgi:signal transduction histidine kinase
VRLNYPLILATAVGITSLLASGVMSGIELPVRDLLLRSASPNAPAATVVVAIDESSLRSLGRWPWSRDVLANVVELAAKSGARGVVLDVLLAESGPGDERLAAAMRRLRSIVVSVLDERGEWLLPPAPLLGAAVPAHGNFELDRDGIVRRFASTKQSVTRSLPALPLEAASLVTGAPIPIGQSVAPSFRTPAQAIPQLSVANLLADPRAAEKLRGKIVFIGPTALALGDRVLTPTSRRDKADPGVTVHAAATESLIRGETIHGLPPLASGLVVALAIALLTFPVRARSHRFFIAGVFVLGTIALAASLLTILNVAIPLVTLLATGVLAIVVQEARKMTSSLRRSHAAAESLERGLGVAGSGSNDVDERLERLAGRVIEQREHDLQARQMLAHELRTPLASMRSLTQLLGRFELSEGERRRVTTLLEQEAGKLQSLIQGLLELEQLPLRQFESAAVPVDLGEVVRQRIEFLRSSTDRALDISGEGPLPVRADPALLERVIDNLVTNAIKYTPAGLPVSITTLGEDGDAVLEIADRGPGIAVADRQRIFERFVRGSTASGTQGLGLGLSLVAEIALWHRGTVTVADSSHGGALFRFKLPLLGAHFEEDRG